MNASVNLKSISRVFAAYDLFIGLPLVGTWNHVEWLDVREDTIHYCIRREM